MRKIGNENNYKLPLLVYREKVWVYISSLQAFLPFPKNDITNKFITKNRLKPAPVLKNIFKKICASFQDCL
jgi:hypothetical protein